MGTSPAWVGGTLPPAPRDRGRMDETEHGRWVFRDKNIHRCKKPSSVIGVKSGDIWECGECKKQWKVKVNSDQREGTWLTWTEHTTGQQEAWRSPSWRD